MSPPPQVLDDETVERLLGAVDRSTAIGKRDHAVLLLAARYGMRASYIRRLQLPNIDWRGQRIVFVQSKSQRPLELPLLADVDHALVDYLGHGRPACKAREVFVRHHRPIGPLTASVSFWDAMQHAFKAAGMEAPNGQRGLYLLRHSAATRMLRQGVSFDTISDVLGHASVESTRIYAQVDIAGLRSVALSSGEVRA
jgi:integrase/recombinase XerD